jgi:Tfp pilus assembly protein PilO
MNLITPVILIIISAAIFFGYVDPNYRGQNLSSGNRSIQSLQAEHDQYQEALNNTTNIRMKRDALIQKRGEISPANLERLEQLLPDNIDNIKLVIDMNQIGKDHNLVLRGIKLNNSSGTGTDKIGEDNNKYGTVKLSFSVNASYDNFQNFLNDLEKSLRLVDIVDLSVIGNDTGLYDFSVSLKTYWLK